VTRGDYASALAEAQLDQLQFTARCVPTADMVSWMRNTLDPETLGGAVRSIAQLHAWMGALLHGLRAQR
jgi:hypothetical protein